MAVVPKNGDNDVKAGVVKENVELSRESRCRCHHHQIVLMFTRIDQIGGCRCLLIVSTYAFWS